MKPDHVTIFLAHPDDQTRASLERELLHLGHEIAGQTALSCETVSICSENPPDLIVSGIQFEDGDGIDALIEISKKQCVPSVVVTKESEVDRVAEAMDDHVMAYLIEPVTAVDLKASIHVVLRRFEQLEDLHKENKSLEQALETRKLLERAKGVVMAAEGLSEEEAYLKIRDDASGRRIKISEVAREIIDSHTDQV